MSSHWEVVYSKEIKVPTTAEELWEACIKYFNWCDENPLLSAGVKSTRPYSLKGMCLHCGLMEEYFRDVRNSSDKESMYYVVVSRVLYIIYVQNIEMAMVGAFNVSLAMKLVGMDNEEVDTRDITVTIVESGASAPLSQSESEAIKKVELELENMVRG
jgi:hypothetical protein